MTLPTGRGQLLSIQGRRGEHEVMVSHIWHAPTDATVALAQTSQCLTGTLNHVPGASPRLGVLGLTDTDVRSAAQVAQLDSVTRAVLAQTPEVTALGGEINKMQRAGQDYATLGQATDPDGSPSRFGGVMPMPYLKRSLWLILAVVAAAALLVPCAGASARTSVSRSRSSARRVELGCARPTAASIGRASSGPTAGRLGTAAGAEGQQSIKVWFLKTLAETAISFTGRQALGWLLPMISGQPNLDAAFVSRQFDEVNGRLDALAQQQYQDCQALMESLTRAVNEAAYTNLAAEMNDQIALLRTYRQEFNNILTALQRNGGDVDRLSSKYKEVLRAMLSGTSGGLRNIINTIDVKESESGPGAKSLLGLYSRILTDELHDDPYQTHIFSPAFLNAGAAQQGYYAALIDEAVYLYSNVAHLTFTDGAYKHANDPESVAELANLALKYTQRWTSVFAEGPGHDNWVSQGHGYGLDTIPDGTVLDYRNRTHPLLWTIAPVAVNGDSSDPAPYYCASIAQFCYADQYNGSGQVGDTRLVRPSPKPIGDLIAPERVGGVADWRIPTSGDWSSLVQGATGGLPTWGRAHHLGDMFATQKLVSHYGGKDQTLTIIAPILVNVGSTSPRYSLLSSTDPTANKLTLQNPDISDPTQNDVAGRLFLVHDYEPTTPPKPIPPTRALRQANRISQAEHTLAARPLQAPRAGKFGAAFPLASAARVSREVAGPAAVPAPTTFSTPTACSSNSTYKVPSGVGSVKIAAAGGAGADGTHKNKPTAPGGVGGSVTETVPVTAGETLYVQVGGAGRGHDSRQGGVGGGGNGGLSRSAYTDAGDYAGGGGGASGVATSPNCSRWLIAAGGGGGGGGGFAQYNNSHNPHGDWSGGRGGNGCATVPGCAPAADGNGFSANLAGKAGAGAPDNHGGAIGIGGGSVSNAAGDGSTGKGGDGGGSVKCCTGVGGGGGGGGGYYGGGGGGGAGSQAGGGGGAGGASFAIPGATGVSYGLGASGQAGSVTITPIAKPPVSISLSASSGRVAWDQPLPVKLTATLPADATGTVTFRDNYGDTYGPAPIRNGKATVNDLEHAPPVGPVQLSAAFAGDAHYAANNSAPVTVTVSKTTPFMNLTITGTVLTAGEQPRSLVVQMPAHATGSVGFYNDVNGGCDGRTGPEARCQGLGVAPIRDGYATLTQLSTPLLTGKNYLHASYGGDGENAQASHYDANDSNVVTVTVTPESLTSTRSLPPPPPWPLRPVTSAPSPPTLTNGPWIALPPWPPMMVASA